MQRLGGKWDDDLEGFRSRQWAISHHISGCRSILGVTRRDRFVMDLVGTKGKDTIGRAWSSRDHGAPHQGRDGKGQVYMCTLHSGNQRKMPKNQNPAQNHTPGSSPALSHLTPLPTLLGAEAKSSDEKKKRTCVCPACLPCPALFPRVFSSGVSASDGSSVDEYAHQTPMRRQAFCWRPWHAMPSGNSFSFLSPSSQLDRRQLASWAGKKAWPPARVLLVCIGWTSCRRGLLPSFVGDGWVRRCQALGHREIWLPSPQLSPVVLIAGNEFPRFVSAICQLKSHMVENLTRAEKSVEREDQE